MTNPEQVSRDFIHCSADNLIYLKGAGESGKSTILKQMKLLYASGFSMTERKGYRHIIFSNILNSLRQVLEAMVFYGFTFEIGENKVLFANYPVVLS